MTESSTQTVPTFVKSWEEFGFLPHSLEALTALSQTPWKIVVITNQSGVGRGLLADSTLEQMHARMIDRVRASGGRIDAIYYCSQAPIVCCDCRKPAPGLDINLTLSWVIGDSHRDVQAAVGSGVKAILLDRILPDPSVVPAPPFQFVRAADLPSAIRIILDSPFVRSDEAGPA